MTEEILSLSTIVQRDTINITSKQHPNGKLYELVSLADLGPYEHALIFQRNDELGRLKTLKKPTAAQTRQLNKMLDDTVKLVCPSVEPRVLAALTDQQKEMIVLTWAVNMNAQGAAEGNARSPRTTAASSRGSKRSPVATPKRGSTPPRGR